MPARRFDRARMRSVRRAADIPQADVASGVAAADSTVAGWELGSSVPDQEKLPALARVLKQDLDKLFPRRGLPDLTDLRCDAGLYRYEVAKVIGTKSDGPVAGAEQGVRPLKEKYIRPLAGAYGVTEDELKQAQARSLAKVQGEETMAEPADNGATGEPPQTLSQKITLILERSYPEGTAPRDGEIADAVNAYAGAQVATAEDIERIRTGKEEDPAPVVLQGLAETFGVSALYFEPNDAVARQVYEGLRLMSAARTGQVRRVRGRGSGPEGLSPDVLALLNDLAIELEEADPDTGE